MSVELMIELGHKVWKNIKPTKEGYTHDWIMFVQGVNGNEIKHFVERVVFHLPDSYPDPKQIKEKPPFFVSESTSQSLSVQIDVFFCTKEKFNNVTYIYDLQISDQDVNNSWEEKLIFNNPCRDFMVKLLLAGGKVIDVPKAFDNVKCKVEPVEETEKSQDIANNAEILNNRARKVEDLHKLLKENENLRNANEDINEKIVAREKLIAFYGETASSYETSISTTNMGIKKFKKKIEVNEKKILTLKSQLKALQNELLLCKNSMLNPEEIQKRNGPQKRKNADLGISVAENNYILQLTKKISSLYKVNFNTSESSPLLKKQNICETNTTPGNAPSMHNQQNELLPQKDSPPGIFDGKKKRKRYNKERRNRLKRKMNGDLNSSADMKNTLQATESILLPSSSNRNVTTEKNASTVQNQQLPDKTTEKNASLVQNQRVSNEIAKKSAFMTQNQQNELLFTNSSSNISNKKGKNRQRSNKKKNKTDLNITPSSFNSSNASDGEKYAEGSSIKANTPLIGMWSEPRNKDFIENPPLHEQDVEYSSTSCEENDKKPDLDLKMSNSFQNENMQMNTAFQKFCQGIDDATAPKLIEFMNEHHQKLAAEINRIKNTKISLSKGRKFKNPLVRVLKDVNDNDCIYTQHFKNCLHSLVQLLIDPEKSFNMATLIYLVVNYLCRCEVSPVTLPTYIENLDKFVLLRPLENCVISAFYEIERMSMPQFNGLMRNTLNIIHQVIISKKRLPATGLSSLCRVFMQICKLNGERWEPLFLCCELQRLEHPFAPYLINSLAAVWRAPFYLSNNISVEEKMLLGSITFAVNIKPKCMTGAFWQQTCRMTSEYFHFPMIVDRQEAVKFLSYEITSRCVTGSFENLWMLTLPLTIFVSKKTLDWKMNFKQEYILPNLLHFSTSATEHAFSVFCNLYVDIFSVHPGTPDELLQYFSNTALYKDKTFVHDCAAVALLKYIGYTGKHVPAALRDWFLSNQNKPILIVILDLYCKKVMESHDNHVLLEDIIIL